MAESTNEVRTGSSSEKQNQEDHTADNDAAKCEASSGVGDVNQVAKSQEGGGSLVIKGGPFSNYAKEDGTTGAVTYQPHPSPGNHYNHHGGRRGGGGWRSGGRGGGGGHSGRDGRWSGGRSGRSFDRGGRYYGDRGGRYYDEGYDNNNKPWPSHHNMNSNARTSVVNTNFTVGGEPAAEKKEYATSYYQSMKS